TDEPVFIRADKSLKYDDVIFVLKSIKNLGFNKVALQTE
ncbi:biopolymer transporter ExbD, partial [Campylobacter coli]